MTIIFQNSYLVFITSFYVDVNTKVGIKEKVISMHC